MNLILIILITIILIELLTKAMSLIRMPLTTTMHLADVIVNKATSIGLLVKYYEKTPADGNCLYHAIIECMEHKKVGAVLYRKGFHDQLRRDIVNFVLSKWGENFVNTWIQQHLEEKKCTHIHILRIIVVRQKKSVIYGDELFISGAAISLKVAIAVTTTNSCIEEKYYIYFGQTRMLIPNNKNLN